MSRLTRDAGSADELLVFGKHPARGDFLRRGMHSTLAANYETWLAEAVEVARGELPALPVRFMVRCSADQPWLAGAWAPSRDSVGRAFPLSVARPLKPELTAEFLPLMPTFLEHFFADAEALVAQAAAAPDSEELRGELPLTTAHESELPAEAFRMTDAVHATTVSAWAQRLYPSDASTQLAYALLTLGRALARNGGRTGLLLECPVAVDADPYLWLELLVRASRSSAHVRALVWQPLARHRLLVELGSPSKHTLSALLGRCESSQWFWPLHSDKPEARNNAQSGLAKAVGDAIGRDAPLAELLEACSNEGLLRHE